MNKIIGIIQGIKYIEPNIIIEKGELK